ncbi:MAG: TonB-dependent receptor [Bacteroidetes bacterium]|nr:MAG: TonB-dependent receptor [Bacteroidota bacterium]
MKKFFILCGLLLFVGSTLFGQQIRVTGTVTDASDGNTLPGVTVAVRGTTQGTVTDMNGRYELNAASDAVLVYSFIGMATREVRVDGRSIIDVALQADMVGLEEVIVIGYGTARRETFTGSASTVGSDKIELMPITSVDKALQGAMPGVSVTSSSGQPGSNSQTIIRGIGSISAGTQPLYVVDGIPIATGNFSQQSAGGTWNNYSHNALSHINPNDIASITVLKDASATAIYGSRASNGVILITTKRGREGETNFRVSSQFGFSTRTTEHFEVLNSAEYIQLTNEGRANSGLAPTDFSAFEGTDFDWIGAAFREDAPTTNFEVSANGGTARTKFFASLSYFDQKGIAIGSDLERLSARLNLDNEATERLSFGMNLGLSFTEQGTAPAQSAFFTSPVTGSYLLPPIYSAYNEDGTYNMSYPALGGVNFVANNDFNDNGSEAYRLITNVYAQYKILDNLVFRSQFGVDYLNLLEEHYDDPRAKGNTAFESGRATVSDARNLIWSNSNTLNFSETFDNVHNINVLLGHEAQAADEKDFYTASEEFASFQLRRLSSGAIPAYAFGTATGWRVLSVFTRGEYNYDGRYYFSSTFRRDGSSRFGRDNRYANFWSVGGSWRISRESFMQDIDFLTNLQLRASYGTAGNSQIGNFSSLGLYGYGRDYNNSPGSSPAQFENADLTWEKNTNYNIGLDFVVFERFSGSIEYYNRHTSDLLLFTPLSSTAGITTMLRNVGEMENKGLEFQANLILLPHTSEFQWNFDFNISANKNSILKLVDGEDIPAGIFIRREGESFLSYYAPEWAGVNPANGRPLWKDADGNITNVYTNASNSRNIVGNADPDYQGGFTNTFSYKGFSLSTFFSYSVGGMLFDDTYRLLNSDGAFVGFNQSRDQLKRWTEEGQLTDTPIRLNGNATSSNAFSTRNLYDNSYLRLKNVTLSYRVPASIAGLASLNSARIYVQGQNLLTWTDYPGMDPEQNFNASVWFVYPQSRTITFGLDLTF